MSRSASSLTLAEARARLRAIGWTIYKQDGEYRINPKGASEESAYYTTDLADAMLTARAEQQRREEV